MRGNKLPASAELVSAYSESDSLMLIYLPTEELKGCEVAFLITRPCSVELRYLVL